MAERMNNLTGSEWLQKSFSIWREIAKSKEERDTKHPALFPQKLAEELISIYTREDSELILDPFVGIGSTLRAAVATNRNAVGLDLNPHFCSIAKQRVEAARANLFGAELSTSQEVINADSRNLLDYVKPDSVDLVVTSPPYWDILNQRRTADSKEIRNYSDDDLDIGNITSYEEFLGEIKLVFSEVFKALKPNKRCVSVVMDLRKKDKFYPLHEDQSRIMREIGFELEEYVIWDRQREYNNMRTLGYPWVFRFNKVHEFICIYWKR